MSRPGTSPALELCWPREWIAQQNATELYFYCDGHVRVYHGEQTALPRHYVARQRLCLRATTDYWINAMDGQPFLYLNKEVDPGLIATLKQDVIPWLEQNVASQVSQVEWRSEEFTTHRVQLAGGEIVTMKLAERGIRLSNQFWVSEIRKLSDGGHQTSILATNFQAPMTTLAPSLFARWSQVNFFRYMREHYGLDALDAGMAGRLQGGRAWRLPGWRWRTMSRSREPQLRQRWRDAEEDLFP